MGYINPLLDLPARRALLALPPEQRAPLEAVLRELREQANEEAERSWSGARRLWLPSGVQYQRMRDTQRMR